MTIRCNNPNTRDGERCTHPVTIEGGPCGANHHAPAAGSSTPTGRTQGVAPVLAQPPAEPVESFIEIPTTKQGWRDAATELERRMQAYADSPDVPIAVSVRQRADMLPFRLRVSRNPEGYGYGCELAGDVTLPGGRMYYVRGPHLNNLHVATRSMTRLAKPEPTRRVKELVAAALAADGEHVRVLAVYSAYCAVDAQRKAQGRFAAPEETGEEYLAGTQLLKLAVLDRLHGRALDAARVLIDGGYVGPVQDLMDAATAVTAAQSDR